MGMQEPCPLCGVVEWAHGVKYEQERIIKLLNVLATHKDCNLGEHHEDYVWNSPLGIIEVLTEWNSEPIALIKGEK